MGTKTILVTGGSGKLGTRIRASKLFSNLLTPDRNNMDLRDEEAVKDYVENHDFDGVIHAAALVDIVTCEKNPGDAIFTNIIGTANLVRAVLAKNQKIRFIYISSDQVYNGVKGNFKETDSLEPCNTYGFTKAGGECAARLLPNACVIRTSFFVPEDIIKKYNDSPDDMYSSKLPIDDLVKNISIVYSSDIQGTINIGSVRMSSYERFREYNPSITKITFEEVRNRVPEARIARDSSLDSGKWEAWLTNHPNA